MKKTLVTGLLHLLPLALSIWIFWSITVTLDGLGASILQFFGVDNPWPGIGFIVVVGALLGAGIAFEISPIRWLYRQIETQLMRFPIIKTVYGAIKDMASLISTDEKDPSRKQTVLHKQANGAYTVGFITSETLPAPLQAGLPDEDEWVCVLLQLSYQMAGVTSIVRKSDLIYVDWSFEEAMRFMLTAGITQADKQPVTDN